METVNINTCYHIMNYTKNKAQIECKEYTKNCYSKCSKTFNIMVSKKYGKELTKYKAHTYT